MGVNCDRCGRWLDDHSVRYIVEIAMTADVSPGLDLDLSEEEVAASIRAVMSQLERVGEEDAMQQVHQRMVFILCPACRARFGNNPLGGDGAKSGSLQ